MNIPLLDPSPSEDNLQFMENSYKLDNSSTTSINITNEPTEVPENQTQSKMSLPVNLNIASPVLRFVYIITHSTIILKENRNILLKLFFSCNL